MKTGNTKYNKNQKLNILSIASTGDLLHADLLFYETIYFEI